MDASTDPIRGPIPAEVALPRAPLVRVIAQVRFPLIASIEQRAFIAPFQERIRQKYAYLKDERSQNMLVVPGGTLPLRQEQHWRFQDRDETWRWRVTLAPNFLAVETTEYKSRESFMKRLAEAVEALFDVVKPAVIERIGVRYVDRICGQEFDRIGELVRPELLGVLGSDISAQVSHVVSEAWFDCPDSRQLMVRSAMVPAGKTIDPSSIPPIDEQSWLLDIDVAKERLGEIDADAVLAVAEEHAQRAYAFFRWAVTPAFLSTYGGNNG